MSEGGPQEFVYSDLTWPEADQAAVDKKVILLPIGSTEQHGHHLPLDTDNLLATEICMEAGRRAPDKILVAPNIPYGYNIHGLDYPGTVHVAHNHFLEYCLDVCKSFAYHGFKRIVIVNGHGGNTPMLDMVGRRANLETDAVVCSFMWWNLLRVDPNFVSSFRESVFPGGIGHACEVETAMYLYLAGQKVQMDKAKDFIVWYNRPESRASHWGDAFGGGPVNLVEWASTFLEDGTFGQPTLATAEKGKLIFDETVRRLVEFVDEFRSRKVRPRVDHHSVPPTSPLPEV